MIELVVFVVAFGLFLMCAACSFGRAPSSGRVKMTRPDEKTVDGFGGTRGYDYSYSGQSGMGQNRPFPVGLRLERKKTETHRAYSMDDDEEID
ncbi:MAG: hypothetical protein ACFFD3_07210 [Candidatus Thorarchaeota archaeon]